MQNNYFYKRHLPHYQFPGYSYHVVFRLKNSIPLKVIEKLKIEKERELSKIASLPQGYDKKDKYLKYQQNYFLQFDSLLANNSNGPKWLSIEEVAEIVREAIHYRDNKVYDLICYTIMPNHVHVIFTPLVKQERNIVSQQTTKNFVVTKILQELKKHTALECSKILGASGAFWQGESYDHMIRNENELLETISYVLNNPVKAGLVEKWEEWKWSYCKYL
ncbi:transposase [Melioribacteraceae bacterium 4301-Me]|uniref:transposase n=1 Tax=Pyranulibacter aquaticus TaxID=3163344 RepID=UPI0035953E03